MIEVLRVVVPAVELRPMRDQPDPVVLKGVTLAPRHGVRVVVGERRGTASGGGPRRRWPPRLLAARAAATRR